MKTNIVLLRNASLGLVSLLLMFSGCKPRALQLRVASYNLRLDTGERDSLNNWPNRKDRVKALIRYHDLDIVGTQEGFLHQLQAVCELPDYAFTGSGRDDGKEAGEHSAIIYRKDKYELLEQGDFWLSETPERPSKGWDATCCNRICSWAKFRDRETKRSFFFFNVHFDHEGVTARRESGKLMVEKIKAIAGEAPTICTGDFNSRPDTEQIQTLSAFLHDSYLSTAEAPYGPVGTFNGFNYNAGLKSRIDYVFVNDGFRVLKYGVLTDADNGHFPSDHLPVVVLLKSAN